MLDLELRVTFGAVLVEELEPSCMAMAASTAWRAWSGSGLWDSEKGHDGVPNILIQGPAP